MSTLVTDQYIATNHYTDSLNKIHQRQLLDPYKGCVEWAANSSIREAGSQAVFEIFSAIHCKTWGLLSSPLYALSPINIMEITLVCMVGLRRQN